MMLIALICSPDEKSKRMDVDVSYEAALSKQKVMLISLHCMVFHFEFSTKHSCS